MTVSRLPFASTGIFLNPAKQSVLRPPRKTPVNSKSVTINPPYGVKCGLNISPILASNYTSFGVQVNDSLISDESDKT